MIQWDQILGVFCCLNIGNMCSGKYVVFVVVIINNYCQCFVVYGDKGFCLCFMYGFCFGGDIYYVCFVSGVDMGQL